MNYYGSYRKLLGNSKSAMIAAIEIYNKPSFQYRDECVVILLLNAWELSLKALLSKNKKSIYYPKKRNQPYRTLSWQDAFEKAKSFFPQTISPLPIHKNLDLLCILRDNAVHFYNAKGFGVVSYALAQTCIKNFRDILNETFGLRLEDEINWQLLPLGLKPPIDIVSYISGGKQSMGVKTNAVRQFLSKLSEATVELKNAGEDTGRLLTVFNVKLESVKKIGDSDVLVGVEAADGSQGPLAVIRKQDPNVTHPLRQRDIVGKKAIKAIADKLKSLGGKPFTSHVFQAIVWRYGLKQKPQYCWRAKEGILVKYSNDILLFLSQLPDVEIEVAVNDYKQHHRKKRDSERR